MITLLSIVAVGFLLGMAHATDPDHVLAVTTIVNRESRLRKAALVGLAWGVGHTVTIFIVGTIVIILGVSIPAQLELSMELLVCLMLVVLGAASLDRFFRQKRAGGISSPQVTGSRSARSLAVGIVHGLAGSAAVALLVLTTISDATWGLIYLLLFGAGTILGMTLFTLSFSSASAYLSRRFHGFSRWMSGLAGAGSIAFGLFMAYFLLQ